MITIIVKGTFNNGGTIAANGESPGLNDTGAGGGGMILLFALGTLTNLGTIECVGGDATRDGGAGGGGHIHCAAHDSAAGITAACDVSGGSSGSGGAGSDGTIEAVDLDTYPSACFGGQRGEEYTGWINEWIERSPW
jgi:hypothetical protein